MKRTGLLIVMAAITAAFVSCGGRNGKTIQIKGSDTEVNLVANMAEIFMKKNPEAKIAVAGGGSGTGIAALLNKTVDIANASRGIKDKEIEEARSNNIDPRQVVIATDGVSVILNPDNPVNRLTISHLSAIFTGEITNWEELGGPDLKITKYGRQSNSGTFEFFKKRVLSKQDFSEDTNRMNGNAQIVESVKNDKSGIGYVGIGYIVGEDGKIIPGIKVTEIAEAGGVYYFPDEKNIMGGSYPLTRPLNQYIDGTPDKKIIEFLKFELSPEGESIVKRNGFFPVQPQYKELNKKLGLYE